MKLKQLIEELSVRLNENRSKVDPTKLSYKLRSGQDRALNTLDKKAKEAEGAGKPVPMADRKAGISVQKNLPDTKASRGLVGAALGYKLDSKSRR